MGYPRSHLVDTTAAGTYHCVSRCVRRAHLCGVDAVTGRSYEHRRAWVERRLLRLARVFAVDVYGYAVMSNHVHLVVHVDPTEPRRWSDCDVIRRWRLLGPRRRGAGQRARGPDALGPERVEVLRGRLGSLSWFMRCLNEFIARRANREDECTGHFWEGRFKSQALLDDRAVLACMAYVDLNPLRAGLSGSADRAAHTSAALRTASRRGDRRIRPVAGSLHTSLLEVSDAAYRRLLRDTAASLGLCELRGRGRLRRSRAREGPTGDWASWCDVVTAIETGYAGAVGGLEALRERARRLGMRWSRGMGVAPAG